MFATGLTRDLAIPPDELGVYVDVVLLDPRGYVPRIALWDTNPLNRTSARLYAAPVWKVLEDELGSGRVVEVEVWHLRSTTTWTVAASAAEDALADVANIVHRIAA